MEPEPEEDIDYRNEFFDAVKTLIDEASTLSDYPLDGHLTAKMRIKTQMRKAVRKLYHLVYGGCDKWAEWKIRQVTYTPEPDEDETK